MATLEKKKLKSNHETKPSDKMKMESAELEGATVVRMTWEPGWKWSVDLKPIAKTESCQMSHIFYQISGKMHVKMDNGDEMDFEAGDFVTIPPGHDGWVVGDEPVVAISFDGKVERVKK